MCIRDRDRDVDQVIGNIRAQECFIQWISPAYGWMALNTDGAAKGCPGPAGGGGLIRDHLGQCIGAFASNLGTCSAIRAEFLALLQGLQLAWSKGIQLLDVRMDNKACISIIQGDQYNRGLNMHVVNQCKQLINQNGWTVTLTHCYREANRAADWLANHGLDGDKLYDTFASLPTDLAKVLREDLQGVAIARRILI